jgi:hypothetical protein
MSLEKAIRNVLTNNAGVSGQLGGRIYPQRRPMGTALPCAVYQVVFQEINQALETQAGIERTRMSIEVMDDSYGGTKTNRNNIQTALINYTGTVEGEVIHSVRLESTVDIDEVNDPGSEFGTYRIVMDFVIWHTPE